MPNLYQLECQAAGYNKDLDTAIRRRQYLQPARGAVNRVGQSVRSVFSWGAVWSASHRAGGLRP